MSVTLLNPLRSQLWYCVYYLICPRHQSLRLQFCCRYMPALTRSFVTLRVVVSVIILLGIGYYKCFIIGPPPCVRKHWSPITLTTNCRAFLLVTTKVGWRAEHTRLWWRQHPSDQQTRYICHLFPSQLKLGDDKTVVCDEGDDNDKALLSDYADDNAAAAAAAVGVVLGVVVVFVAVAVGLFVVIVFGVVLLVSSLSSASSF